MRAHAPTATVAAAGATALLLSLAACGDGTTSGGGAGGPRIVVTTSVLGDITANLVGDDAEVEVLMPPGADPHQFQPSARQAATLREADLVVVNGAGLEAGLGDSLASAEDDGTPTFAAVDHVATLPADADDRGDDHDHGPVDPHVLADPARAAAVAEALAAELPELDPALDTPGARDRAAAYVDDLRALDAEVEDTLAAVPDDRRSLVTDHDVLAYLADRYGFAVIGAVVPSTSTQAAPSAGDLDALADALTAAGVDAVFTDVTTSDELARTLADEVGDDVEVVGLYTESLGEEGSDGATYVDMVRTDASRIADALAP